MRCKRIRIGVAGGIVQLASGVFNPIPWGWGIKVMVKNRIFKSDLFLIDIFKRSVALFHGIGLPILKS
jgi:hypothetical protein